MKAAKKFCEPRYTLLYHINFHSIHKQSICAVSAQTAPGFSWKSNCAKFLELFNAVKNNRFVKVKMFPVTLQFLTARAPLLTSHIGKHRSNGT